MKEKQVVQLAMVPGFQHAEDNYWYRPLVFGKDLFMYVAHIPPGGDMPPNGHAEKEEFETCLFMLEGELEISYDGDRFTIGPETALHVPLGTSFGVKNCGKVTASYVLTFSPPPEIESVEALRQRYAERNRTVKTPEETNALRAMSA